MKSTDAAVDARKNKMTQRDPLPDKPFTLSEMSPGEGGYICSLDGPEAVVRRFLEMGLVEESYIEVLHQAPFGKDPIAVKVRGGLLGIRRHEARGILLRKAPTR